MHCSRLRHLGLLLSIVFALVFALVLAVGAGLASADTLDGSGSGAAPGCGSCIGGGSGGASSDGSIFFSCIQKAGYCGPSPADDTSDATEGELSWPSDMSSYTSSDTKALTDEVITSGCEGSAGIVAEGCPLWKATDYTQSGSSGDWWGYAIRGASPTLDTPLVGQSDTATAPVTAWVVRMWRYVPGDSSVTNSAPFFERVVSAVPSNCGTDASLVGTNTQECVNQPQSWFYDNEHEVSSAKASPTKSTNGGFAARQESSGALTSVTNSEAQQCEANYTAGSNGKRVVKDLDDSKTHTVPQAIQTVGDPNPVYPRPAKPLYNSNGTTAGGTLSNYDASCYWEGSQLGGSGQAATENKALFSPGQSSSGIEFGDGDSWAVSLDWTQFQSNSSHQDAPRLYYALDAPPGVFVAVQVVAISNREQIVPMNWGDTDYEWGDNGTSTMGSDTASDTKTANVANSGRSWSSVGSEQYFRIYEPNTTLPCPPCHQPGNIVTHAPSTSTYDQPKVSVTLQTPNSAETDAAIKPDVAISASQPSSSTGSSVGLDPWEAVFPTSTSLNFYTPNTLYDGDMANTYSSSYPYNYARFEGPQGATASTTTLPAAEPGPNGQPQDELLISAPAVLDQNDSSSDNLSNTDFEVEWQQPTLQNPCLGINTSDIDSTNGDALPWSKGPTDCPVEDAGACKGTTTSVKGSGDNSNTADVCEPKVRDAWDDQLTGVGQWESRWLASITTDTSGSPSYTTRAEYLRCADGNPFDPQPENTEDCSNPWIGISPATQTVGTTGATNESINGTFSGSKVTSGQAEGYLLIADSPSNTAATSNCTSGTDQCGEAFIKLDTHDHNYSAITNVEVDKVGADDSTSSVYQSAGNSLNKVTNQPQLSFCTEGLPDGSKLATTSDHEQVTSSSGLEGDNRCDGYDVKFHWGPSDSSTDAQYCATSETSLTPSYFKTLGQQGSASAPGGTVSVAQAPGQAQNPNVSLDSPYLEIGSNDYNTVGSTYGFYGSNDFGSGKSEAYPKSDVFNKVSIPPYVGDLPGYDASSSDFSVGTCTGTYFTESVQNTNSIYTLGTDGNSKSSSSASGSTETITTTTTPMAWTRVNYKSTTTYTYYSDGESSHSTGTTTTGTAKVATLTKTETVIDTTVKGVTSQTSDTVSYSDPKYNTASNSNAPVVNWTAPNPATTSSDNQETESCTPSVSGNGCTPSSNKSYSGYYDNGYWALNTAAGQGWGINNSAARLPSSDLGIGYDVNWTFQNASAGESWDMFATYDSLDATWDSENESSAGQSACGQSAPANAPEADLPTSPCSGNDPASAFVAVQEPRSQQ
jgi:hypothetical protein